MKMPKFNRSWGSKAQAALEMALAFPIVMLLVMGIIEGGRLLFIYTTLSAAGREAARYGAGIGQVPSTTTALYNDCDGIRAAAVRIGAFAGVQAANVAISHDTGPGTAASPYCRPGDPPISINLGDRIVVKISTGYNPVVPFVPIPNLTLLTESSHTLIKEAPVIAYTPQVVNFTGACESSLYTITVTNPMGPIIDVTIVAKSLAGTPTPTLPPSPTPAPTATMVPKVNKVEIVWDPTSGPILNQITGDLNIYTINGAGPLYTTNFSEMTFNGSGRTFHITFSKVLKNNAIIRFTMNNTCTFGQ